MQSRKGHVREERASRLSRSSGNSGGNSSGNSSGNSWKNISRTTYLLAYLFIPGLILTYLNGHMKNVTNLSMISLSSVLARMEGATTWNISRKCRCCRCSQSIAWRHAQANRKQVYFLLHRNRSARVYLSVRIRIYMCTYVYTYK